jgi:hypothetical protein
LITGTPVIIQKQSSGTAVATCTNGKKILGGGYMTGVPQGSSSSPEMMTVFTSFADSLLSWSVKGFNNSNGGQDRSLTLTAYAVCAVVP